MKVILIEQYPSLGKIGDVVEVKRGYAVNYLFKRGLAVEYTQKNANQLKSQLEAKKAKEAAALADAQALASKIQGTVIEIPMKAGAQGKLYGAITTMDIAEKLGNKGFTVDKRDITIVDSETIKELGTYAAQLKLHPQVTAEVQLKIVNEDGEEASPATEEA